MKSSCTNSRETNLVNHQVTRGEKTEGGRKEHNSTSTSKQLALCMERRKLRRWWKRDRHVVLYPHGSQNAGTQRIQVAARSTKIWWVARTHSMVVILSASSTDTRRTKSNNHAKFAVTPHRRSTVLVEHPTQQFHRELGRIRESIRKKFSLNI
jgi:hypothetical protein